MFEKNRENPQKSTGKDGKIKLLTGKQQLFCKEYLVDLNGTQAAIRAGYSSKSAQEQSSKLLSKPMIQSEIAREMKARGDRIDKAADEVVKRLWEIADLRVVGDIGDLIGGQFELKSQEQWSDASKRAVRSVQTTKTIRRFGEQETIEIVNKVRAPEAIGAVTELMKHYGLNTGYDQLVRAAELYGKKLVDVE
jgi:phage terminase small subunit